MQSKALLQIRRLLSSCGVVSLRATISSVLECPSGIELVVSDGVSSVSLPAHVSNAFKAERGRNGYNIDLSAWGYSPFAADAKLSVTAVLQYPEQTEHISQSSGEGSGSFDLKTQQSSSGLVLKMKKAGKLLWAGEIGFLWRAAQITAMQWLSQAKRIKLNYRKNHPNIVQNNRRHELFIDHGFGGGTNAYSVHYFREKRQTNRQQPFALVFDPWKLEFRVTCSYEFHDKILWFKEMDVLCKWISKQTFATVTINSIYGYPSPALLLDCVRRYKESLPGAQMSIMTHDYYSVCPSPHLINDQGWFCGIPSDKECDRCFSKNKLINVSPSHISSVHEWRSLWRTTYEAADTIRVFSESSLRILSKGHPQIAHGKFEVVPHQVPRLSAVPTPSAQKIHIGVMGHLNTHKGARQVHDLMQHVEDARGNIAISLFGSIYPPCEYHYATVHHHYDVRNLPRLIRNAGVNVFFFPSICPETYSFVVDEMIYLGLPIVCFDIGAPADRIRNYAAGSVIPIGNGRDILKAIEGLFEKTYKSSDVMHLNAI